MRQRVPGILIGFFLIILGLLIILDNLYYLYFKGNYITSFVFTAIGLVFLSLYLLDKSRIWALIFFGFFVFVGVSVFISESRYIPEDVIGGLLFILIGIGFLFLYLRDKKNWWPIIPMGVLFTLGIMVTLNAFYWYIDEYLAGILFVGNGLTFGYLYLIRNEENKLHWAKIPAVVLLIFGFFILLAQYAVTPEDLVFPSILILAGLVLIIYHISKIKKSKEVVKESDKAIKMQQDETEKPKE